MNMATVLKEEFVRLARRVSKAGIAPIHRTAIDARHDIAALKRRVAVLEKTNRELLSAVADLVAAMPEPAPAPADTARITGKGMRSLRRKLRLSGAAFAALLGVTPQAVYMLERKSGALRVRATTKAAILAVRGLGAREAKARLAEIEAAKKAKKPTGKRGRRKGRK